MAGQPEFQQIVAQAPREKLVQFNQVNNAAIAAGNVEITNFYAPANTIIEIVTAYFYVQNPVGATTGNHTLWLSYNSPTIDVIQGGSKYTDSLLFNASFFQSATDTQYPNTAESILSALKGIKFDSNTALALSYKNGSNVSQNNSRTIRLWGIQRTIS